LDSDGNNITDANTSIDTIRYTIEVIKLISTPTTTQIIVSKIGTSATITAKAAV
jgi:hypothetical protein